jgi:hypothetical protein
MFDAKVPTLRVGTQRLDAVAVRIFIANAL